MPVSPARAAALRALTVITTGTQSLPAALARERAHLRDERDRALAHELVTGTLRWLRRLDYQIALHAHRPVDRLDPAIRNILRVSLYQLLHLDRIPASAVVHDAVELAKRSGARSASGLVNAVLRSVGRGMSNLTWPPASDVVEHLGVTLSHPDWLMRRLVSRLGPERAAVWARFNNTAAPLTLRVNRLETDTPTLIERLQQSGINTELCRFATDALIVRTGNPLTLPAAFEGLFVLQDEASQLVAEYVDAQPGELVLDACAAPGGKTLIMAAAMHDRGMIVAADVRPRRLRLLRRTVAASGAERIALACADLLLPLPFEPRFDRVLVDAPCSGLGTIRRDPDIRWRQREEDLANHAARQRRMLHHAGAAVRPGGTLVYATCSTEPEENQQVIDAFLSDRGDFAQVNPLDRGSLPAGVHHIVNTRGCLETLPDRHGLEGFFAATLERHDVRPHSMPASDDA